MFGEKPIGRTKVRILKIKGGDNVHVQIRAPEPLAFNVHWIVDRSFVCPGTDCAACYSSIGSRWLGMLPVVWFDRYGKCPSSGLLELTASGYERMSGLLRMEGRSDLLGLQVHASRRTTRSPLRCEPIPPADEIAAPCKEVGQDYLADAVATIWGLPACPRGMKFAVWEALAMDRARGLVALASKRHLCSAS